MERGRIYGRNRGCLVGEANRTEMQTRAPTETPSEAGGASMPFGCVDMRRLRAPETFPFPRFMKATSVAMCTTAGGCGGRMEPGARTEPLFQKGDVAVDFNAR